MMAARSWIAKRVIFDFYHFPTVVGSQTADKVEYLASGIQPHGQPGPDHVVLGLADGEFTKVEDRGGQHRRRMALTNSRNQVIEIANAAGGDDRNFHAVGNGASERNIESLTRAVAIHRGQ